MNYLMGHAVRNVGFFFLLLIVSSLIDYFFLALRVYCATIDQPRFANPSNARSETIAIGGIFYPAVAALALTIGTERHWHRCALLACI
ncbi:MAG: hypothetical protein WA996_09395 [Candidatus Promineifilaceae bacterium]